jgi:hypothetical protein
MRFAMSASGEKFTWSGSGASLNDRNLPKKQGHDRNTRRAEKIPDLIIALLLTIETLQQPTLHRIA